MLTREERYGEERAKSQHVLYSQKIHVLPGRTALLEIIYDDTLYGQHLGKITIAPDRITLKLTSTNFKRSEYQWLLTPAIDMLPEITHTVRGDIKEVDKITFKDHVVKLRYNNKKYSKGISRSKYLLE